MLRFLALLLLLANLGFYSWTQGWLDPVVGASPSGDREPERFARQVKPEIVRILPPAGAAPVAVAAASATAGVSCLEAGPFTSAQLPQAEAALAQALPGLAFSTLGGERPGEHRLRVPRADAATAARLATLRLDALGRGFGACSAG
jgi:hypothetical protein